MHDPLAVYYAMTSGQAEWQIDRERDLRIEIQGQWTRGAVEDVNLDLCRSVRVVMSRGRSVSVKGLRLGLVVANAALETGG